MSSIIVNANNITDTINNSTFQVDFDRSVDLTNKSIALLSASLYFSWRNITTDNNIRGPGVALGLVTPFERASRTVLRGASRGFAAVLMARLRR